MELSENWKNRIALLIVIGLGILASRTLLFQSGYFNMHDDLQMMRQLQLEKCFLDFQIPCRWVPDMGYGYGFPLFNFYPPLPYLVGQLFRIIGFSFVDTAKYTFVASIIGSGVTMYFLGKSIFGRIGGIVSAAFYIWAPYHAVDVYVRGAMNESWALVFFPAIFLAAYELIRSKKKFDKKWVVLLALFYAGLFLSHNLMVLIFTPVFGVWLIIHLWRLKEWKKIPQLLLSGVWAFGMAAFFTLPAVFENKFTQVRSQLQGYYDYNAHFVSLDQLLFSRFWGYGPSVWLEEDKMSFQIGYAVWLTSLLSALLLISVFVYSLRHKTIGKLIKNKVFISSIFLLSIGWISAFMTHLKSLPIWIAFPQLGYLQFPWRFLTLVVFGMSFAIGAIPILLALLKEKKDIFTRLLIRIPENLIAGSLIILVVWSSWSYFLPEYGKLGKLTDQDKFTAAAWDLQQTAGIYDYLPETAKRAPTGPQTTVADVVLGEAEIIKPSQGTYWSKFSLNVESESTIRVNTFLFPGWRIFANEEEIEPFIPEDEEIGRIHFTIPKGEYLIYVQFMNTPIRTIANIISFVSLSILLLVILLPKLKMVYNKA